MMILLLVLLFVARGGNCQGFVCKECLEVTKDAQEILSNPHNLVAAIEFVKAHVCANVPGQYRDKCNDMAEEYVSVVFTSLQEYLTPQKICLETGICLAGASANQGRSSSSSSNCALCRYLVLQMKLRLQDPKTQEKLIEFLLGECQKLHNREDECKLLVLEYGPQILASLEFLLADNQLCSTIGMCSSRSKFSADSLLLRDTM